MIEQIGEIAGELDAHRKAVLADPDKKLTLTGLYNVREALRSKGLEGLSDDARRLLLLAAAYDAESAFAALEDAYHQPLQGPESELPLGANPQS